MKKYSKIICMLMILFMITFPVSDVFGAPTQGTDAVGGLTTNNNNFGGGFDPGQIPSGNIEDVGKTKGIFDNIYTTVLFLIQVASVAGIIICGIRYMYASADAKADIKAGMMPFVIGIILVFCASTVAQFVAKVFEQTVK